MRMHYNQGKKNTYEVIFFTYHSTHYHCGLLDLVSLEQDYRGRRNSHITLSYKLLIHVW